MIKQSCTLFKMKLAATLLLVLLSCMEILAQYERDPQPEKFSQLIRESEYIFEGMAVEGSDRTYKVEGDRSRFNGSVLVEISGVLKGNLKVGTIELITAKWLSHGNFHISHPTNGVYVRPGRKYIFFANETELVSDSLSKDIATDNPQKVDVEEGHYGLLTLAKSEIKYYYGPYRMIFDTEREVYRFLKSAGVAVPDSVYKKTRNYNVHQRTIEERFKEAIEGKPTTDKKIQARIDMYKELIDWRKSRSTYKSEEDKLLKKYEKQLPKWERKWLRKSNRRIFGW